MIGALRGFHRRKPDDGLPRHDGGAVGRAASGLKPTGNLYLHCDPTASHYLKIVLDTIFEPENFRNEITWQRTLSKSSDDAPVAKKARCDSLLPKDELSNMEPSAIFQPYDESELDEKTAGKYHYRDTDGRLYRLDNLINPNPDRPNLTYEFLGVNKVWRWTKGTHAVGLRRWTPLVQTKPGMPRYRRYLGSGKQVSDGVSAV